MQEVVELKNDIQKKDIVGKLKRFNIRSVFLHTSRKENLLNALHFFENNRQQGFYYIFLSKEGFDDNTAKLITRAQFLAYEHKLILSNDLTKLKLFTESDLEYITESLMDSEKEKASKKINEVLNRSL
ncbi:MAG: hypothetical protein R3Y64_09515 [Peptostreptococcaceae bacterium]